MAEPNAQDDTRGKAIELFTYLVELSGLRSQMIRSVDLYEDVIWLADFADLPGCYCILQDDEDRPATSESSQDLTPGRSPAGSLTGRDVVADDVRTTSEPTRMDASTPATGVPAHCSSCVSPRPCGA